MIKTKTLRTKKQTKINPRVKSAEIIDDDISDDSTGNKPPSKHNQFDESLSPTKDNLTKQKKKSKKPSADKEVSKERKKRDQTEKKDKKEKHVRYIGNNIIIMTLWCGSRVASISLPRYAVRGD